MAVNSLRRKILHLPCDPQLGHRAGPELSILFISEVTQLSGLLNSEDVCKKTTLLNVVANKKLSLDITSWGYTFWAYF